MWNGLDEQALVEYFVLMELDIVSLVVVYHICNL